ncbi:MAG: hypothetical protein AB8I69_21105 [Anaerolineae bacterium]
MPKFLKLIFLIHAIVALIVGAPLLIIPGRVLGAVGWAPVEPVINRILGAALLALAWSSFRGWRATDKTQVAFLVEMETAFTVLGCVGVVRHLLIAHYPLIVWIVLAVLALFAIAWIVSLVNLLKK